MKTVNITVPNTMHVLSSNELERLVVRAVRGDMGKGAICEVLNSRYNSKRQVLQVASQIQANDVLNFYHQIKVGGIDIDYSKTFFLLVEESREHITIRQ